MNSTEKNYIIKGTVLAVLLIFLGMISMNEWPKLLHGSEDVITVGIFSDSYWNVQNGYSYQILDDAIRIFEEEHPGIKVEYVSGIMKNDYSEWLAEQLLEGTAPDLFFVLGTDFSSLSQLGALKDLGTLIESDDTFTSEGFYQTAYNSGRYLDKQFALPYECAPRLMFVNKTILKQEGIAMPRENWTWNDFYRICEKVTRDTDQGGALNQFGVVGYGWEDAFYENGVELFTEDGTECNLNNDYVVETVQLLEKLEGLSNGYRVTAKDFDNGKVAFMPMLFSEYRAYKSYPLSIKKYSGFEWECVEMPAGPHGANLSNLDTLMIGMNAKSVHQKNAWEFMKLLTTDERIQSEIFDYSEGVSVLPSVTESDETKIVLRRDGGENVTMNTEVLSSVLERAVVPPRFRYYEQAMEQVDQAIRSVLDGDKNISMELIVRNREINKYLADLRLNRM